MRIGTWNLAGRWSSAHEEFLTSMACDVLLLTEVKENIAIPGMAGHLAEGSMAVGRRWAGVFAEREMTPLPDPHAASAMAAIEGWIFCSSILPWRASGGAAPWQGTTHAGRTESAVSALIAAMPAGVIWGGDWNHALSGPETAGSAAGREHLLGAFEHFDLQVPTALLPHAIEGLLSIDHIAVPRGRDVVRAERLVASVDGRRLSDHDAYVVELGS